MRRYRGLALFLTGLILGWVGSAWDGSAGAQGSLNFQPLHLLALGPLEAQPGPDGPVFPRTAEQLRFRFEITGPLKGETARCLWIAEDIGTVAPPNYTIGSPELDLSGDSYNGSFVLNQPNKGWPTGQYRLEVRVGERLLHTERFRIE